MSIEVKRRGRKKGDTKTVSYIKDPILTPYEIAVEERGFVVQDSRKGEANNFMGSFSSFASALNKIVQYKMANTDKVRTLKEYINEYSEIKNQILSLNE